MNPIMIGRTKELATLQGLLNGIHPLKMGQNTEGSSMKT